MKETLFVFGLFAFACAAMTAGMVPMPLRLVPALLGGCVAVSLFLMFTDRRP